jgi:putative FmdB family regulatory protein
MPIYEYECLGCGQIHEMMQKMSEKPLTECPQCTGKLQKLISHSAFHLKGSGWYATDYAKSHSSPSTNESKKENKTADSKSSSSEAASSDT